MLAELLKRANAAYFEHGNIEVMDADGYELYYAQVDAVSTEDQTRTKAFVLDFEDQASEE